MTFNKFLLICLFFVFFASIVYSATETQWLNAVKNQFIHGSFMTTVIHPDYYGFNPIPTTDANFNCLWEGGFMAYNKKPVFDINPIAGFWSNVTQNTAVVVATQIHQCFSRWSKLYNTKIHALNARQIANSCAVSTPDHHNALNAEPLCLFDGRNFQDMLYDGLWTGFDMSNSARHCICLDNVWPRGTGDQSVPGWIPGDCNYECSGYSYDPMMFPNGGVHPYAWTNFQNGAPTADGVAINLHHFDLSNYIQFFSNTALMVQFNPTNCPAMHTWTPDMAPLSATNCQQGEPAVIPPTNDSPVHYFGMITGMTYNNGKFHFTMCTPTEKKYKIQINPTTAEFEYVEDGNMSNVAQPDSNGLPTMGGRPACWNFVIDDVQYIPRVGGGQIIKSSNWPLFETNAYYWTLHTINLGGMLNASSVDFIERFWFEDDIWPMSTTLSNGDDNNNIIVSSEDDHRDHMKKVIDATIVALFDERVKQERLALQKVKVAQPIGSNKPNDVITLEDAQLIENQVTIPRVLITQIFNTTQNIANVNIKSLRIATAIYISLHAEKKWKLGLTAEQKDEVIYKIFTTGNNAWKGTRRKDDIQVLNYQAVKAFEIYNLENVGKTFADVQVARQEILPHPQRQQQCDAARAKLEVECNKIPQSDKPEYEWKSNSYQNAIVCLQDTSSEHFKTMSILCNAKNLYPHH